MSGHMGGRFVTSLRMSLVLVVLFAVVTSAGPLASVCVLPTATPNEVFAAAELAAIAGQQCGDGGHPLPVVHTCAAPSPAGPPSLIVVGYDAAIAAGVPPANLSTSRLGNEGYVITTIGNTIAISGSKGAMRGTLYAAYAVARLFGVQFLAHDATVVPPCPPTVPSPSLTFVPDLEYRQNSEWVTEANNAWAVRVHNNKGSYNASLGATWLYASPPGFVHTSYHLFGETTTGGGRHPPTDLFKTNNEWFWPHNDPNAYGQLCWANASLITYLTAQVKTFLRAQPNANIISVSQNDNQNYCKDPADAAIIKEEGSPIGPLLRAVNIIADAIKDEFPNVAVDTLAYQYTRPAPKITKPRPNVIVRLCSIECNFAAPLTDTTNAAFQVDMEAWNNVSQRTWIWDYTTNFGNFLAPFPNWYVIGPNIRYFKAHGVSGVFEESAYVSAGGDMSELKAYLMAEMLWDPEQDDRAVIAAFLEAYYGKAAPFVDTYMQLMHNSTVATKYYMHENFPPNAPFLTPQAVLGGAKSFASGLKAVQGDATVAQRLDRSKLSCYYVILLRWDEMAGWAKQQGVAWPIEATKQAAFDEFARVYNATGITAMSEGAGHDLAWLHKQVFGTD